jgi:hypothetical protein
LKKITMLPELKPIKKIQLKSGEVLISAGGFEDRVLAIPSILTKKSPSEGLAIVLEYLPHNEKNRLDEVVAELRQQCAQVEIEKYDLHHPEGFDEILTKRLRNLQARAVCLDISGMSRLAIMIIADVLREMNLPLRIAFAEAREYAPSQEEFESAKKGGEQHLPTSFIHTGMHDVLHVRRLSSVRMQSNATVLIAFDSFNEALCQALINMINPSRFILINGRPPRDELRWREEATKYVHQFLRKEWNIEDDNEPVKTTSTLYYAETYELLTLLYWRFSTEHRIIIAPTGSKMQTLGSYLMRAVHKDIHVEYPAVAGFFADKYSQGVREIWEIDFGNMGDFVSRLRQQEIVSHLGLPSNPVNTEIE